MSYKSKLVFIIIFILSNIEVYALSMQERTEILSAHNQLRDKLRLPRLKWSSELASVAKDWVYTLQENYECQMMHSRIPGLGENLYWGSPTWYGSGRRGVQKVSPSEVVRLWGNERKYYNYDSNRCAFGKVCGHYTQLIWRDTTEVGCAKIICPDKSQVWSCNYNPPGNYRGQRPY
jgi:pathogenesis-related protein 1